MAGFSIIRLLPLLALAFFCLELASIILVGQRVGVFATLLLIIADIVLGVGVIKSAGANAMNELRMPLRAPGSEARLAGGMALRVLAGVLFIVPGFFSDLLALLALAPPVQSWLARRFKPMQAGTYSTREHKTYQSPPRSTMIIEGEVIEISGEVDAPRPDDQRPPDNRS